MRTKKEIVNDLLENGHSNNAIAKITGFLIGKELKQPTEIIRFKKGNDSWEDFIAWFENKPQSTKPQIYHVFAALFEAKDNAQNEYEKMVLNNVIDYLVGEYVLDTTFTNERCVKKSKKH